MSEIDEDMLRRARTGDRQAHAALYRAYAPMVFTLARRMLGSSSLAEDVVQDCFVDVIRKADQFRGESGIGGWIKAIAINRCLSHLRSPWVRRRMLTPAEPAAATDMPIEHRVDAEAMLEQALDFLPPKARAVIWLHLIEGYTHDEIGRLLGRSASYSKSQLARACRQLREMLEPEGPDHEIEPCLGILKTV